jgi:hypothetical protein
MSTRYNFFDTIAVDSYGFPATPQAAFPFNSQGFTLLNRGMFTIQYSFDGVNLHGDLNPADASRGLAFDARNECKVFFRAVDGYGVVRVESWA